MASYQIPQSLALVNLELSMLIDTAAALRLGNGGRDFHLDTAPYMFVRFHDERAFVLFRLAYQGKGEWHSAELIAPASEHAEIRDIVARHNMQQDAEVIELVQVSLPSKQEHRQLLSALNATGACAFRL